MKNPRPLSFGFHHQPFSGWFACGAASRPPGTRGWRSMGMVPPGHVSVPCEESLNESVMVPAFTAVAGLNAPPNVCPPVTL